MHRWGSIKLCRLDAISVWMSIAGCLGKHLFEYLIKKLGLTVNGSCPLLRQSNRPLQWEGMLVNLFQRLITSVHG